MSKASIFLLVLVSIMGLSICPGGPPPLNLEDPEYFVHMIRFGQESLSEDAVYSNNEIVWSGSVIVDYMMDDGDIGLMDLADSDDHGQWYHLVATLADRDGDSCDLNIRIIFDVYGPKRTGNDYGDLDLAGVYCPNGKPLITTLSGTLGHFAVFRIKDSALEVYTVDTTDPDSPAIKLKFTHHHYNYESVLTMVDVGVKLKDPMMGNVIINVAGEAHMFHPSISLEGSPIRSVGAKIFYTFDENTKILNTWSSSKDDCERLIVVAEDSYSVPKGEVAVYIVRLQDIIHPKLGENTIPDDLSDFGESPDYDFLNTDYNPRYIRFAYSGKVVPFNGDIAQYLAPSDFMTFVREYGVEGYSNLRLGTFADVHQLKTCGTSYASETDLLSQFTVSRWQPRIPYQIKFLSRLTHALFIPPIAMSTYYTCLYSTTWHDCTQVHPVMPSDESRFLRAPLFAGAHPVRFPEDDSFFRPILHLKQKLKGPVSSFALHWCPKDTPWLEITDLADYRVGCVEEPDAAPVGYRKNPALKRSERCSNMFCTQCDNDIAVCQACATGFNFNPSQECIACEDEGCQYCTAPNTCGACKPGYLFNEQLECVPSDAQNCLIVWTDLNKVCKQCSVGYKFSRVNKETVCDVCDDDYTMDSEGVCHPNCTSANCNCKVPKTCDNCKTGFYGNTCVTLGDSCKATIPGCSLCTNTTACATCDAAKFLTGSTCSQCITGYDFDGNKTCQSLALIEDALEEVVATFDRDSDNAVIEFASSTANMNTAGFRYTLIDDTDGKSYSCPKCKAEPVPGNPNALQIIFDPTIPILKGRAIVSYNLRDFLPSKKRRLQGTATATSTSTATGNFTIENVNLPGLGKDADLSSYNAYTAINSFRFFATVGLSVLNTGHAFWSTHWWSWLQLWSNFKGEFLTYPDRFLQWHSKWYILVINFGEPFKDWNDWNVRGIACRASNEYPLNKNGCSWTDTFGQNFIVILFVALFCIIVSVLYLILARGIEENATGGKGWLRRILWGLGFNYFLRWIQALQPSIIFFAILQWETHRKTSHMGLGVFLAALFFTYYFFVAVISVLVAFKIAKELGDNKERKAGENLEQVAKQVGGGLFGLYGFLYIDMKTASGVWQLFGPLVEFLRVVLISIFMVAVSGNKVSVGLVFMIEVLRYLYVLATFNTKRSIFYALLDAATGLLFVGYLILKMSSQSDVSEYIRQKNVGAIMGLIVSIMWAICMIDMAFDLVYGIMEIVGPIGNTKEYSRTYGDIDEGPKYGPGSPNTNLAQEGNTNPSSPEARPRDSGRPEIGSNTRRDMDENPQGQTYRSEPEIGDRTRREMEEGPGNQSRANESRPEIGDRTRREMEEGDGGARTPQQRPDIGDQTKRDMEEGPVSDNRANINNRG